MVDDRSTAYGQYALTAQAPMEMDGLSYQEYFKKVEEMIGNLKQHWKLEQRVKALKIAIQLAKLLADTSQMKLYSKKYKMITDTLDEFGRLIYIRIQLRANGESTDNLSSASHNHTDSSIKRDNNSTLSDREQAKETCRNWFMKIASIRELVPRFYTELAILKSCDHLLKPSPTIRGGVGVTEEQFYAQSLKRLSKAAWGFGNPIVAIHARAYLCKVAEKLISWNSSDSGDNILFELILMNLKASAILTSQLEASTVLRTVQFQNVDLGIFFDLISNAMQSILNFVTLKYELLSADDDDHLLESAKNKLETIFSILMEQVRKNECPVLARNIILHSTLRALPDDIIAIHAKEILDTIQMTYKRWQKSDDDMRLTTSTLYTSMGSFALALDGSDAFKMNFESQTKDSILTSIDMILEDLFKSDTMGGKSIGSHYLRCFKAWLSYANHYVEHTEVDKLLNRFLARIKKDRQYVNHYSILVDLIKTLVSSKRTVDEFRRLFALKSFSQLLELLRRDDNKFEVSKWIFETMRANLKLNNQLKHVKILDRDMINFILRLSGIMNDSLSLLTAIDDIEHLSQLITYFLDRIPIEDYKERLDFHSRCRGFLGNLNPILEYLAHQTLELAVEYQKIERKRKLKRNYLNGCLAFTFITIPALNSPMTRLDLLIKGSRLALSHMSLSLADYYLKQTLISLNEQMLSRTPLLLYGTNSEGMSTPGGDTKTNGGPEIKVISKQLLTQVQLLLDLMLNFEDHIDFKHKLVFTNLIKNSFTEYPSLIENIKLMNIIEEP